MGDGRDFHGAKIALTFGERLVAYKRNNIPTIPSPGLWDLPGGGSEGDETPIPCAVREVEEEFGLVTDPAIVQWCRPSASVITDMPHNYFLAAPLDPARLSDIRFGSEGKRRFAAGVTIFSEQVYRSGMVQHGDGEELLQPAVLILERLQPLRLADIHTAILGLPFVDDRIADTLLAAQVGHGTPGLVLFQNADDLVFGKSAALHLWSSRLGQSLSGTGLAAGGSVKSSLLFLVTMPHPFPSSADQAAT